MPDDGFILVLNAGSSSLKFRIFDRHIEPRLSGQVADIGLPTSSIEIDGAIGSANKDTMVAGEFATHQQAIKAVIQEIEQRGFGCQQLLAVGHRVVHGGTLLNKPTVIDPDTLRQIEQCDSLAPLHNPHNRAGIEAIAELYPDVMQLACFDTAFHADNPAVATSYALPETIRQTGKRRYGFHGTSYEAIVRLLPQVSEEPLPDRVLALHLGNGASVCAIRKGRSVATNMGYSPLEGLTMGTRAGSIDPGLVLELASEMGVSETSDLLNRHAGLIGLSGVSSNMADLLQKYDTHEGCRFAVDHFCYWAARHSASMIGAMQGLDAIVFTGGIGEKATLVRAGIVEYLQWLDVVLDEQANHSSLPRLHSRQSRVGIWIIAADEEQQIAQHVAGFLD